MKPSEGAYSGTVMPALKKSRAPAATPSSNGSDNVAGGALLTPGIPMCRNLACSPLPIFQPSSPTLTPSATVPSARSGVDNADLAVTVRIPCQRLGPAGLDADGV